MKSTTVLESSNIEHGYVSDAVAESERIEKITTPKRNKRELSTNSERVDMHQSDRCSRPQKCCKKEKLTKEKMIFINRSKGYKEKDLENRRNSRKPEMRGIENYQTREMNKEGNFYKGRKINTKR